MKVLRMSLWMSIKPVLTFALLALLAGSAFTQSGGGSSRLLAKSRDLGPEDPSKVITVTVWLNQHNKAALDELVRQMYEPGSANYHRWLTREQYKATFAPTAQDEATVRSFLASHNLTVSSVDKYHHYLMARGRITDVQNAFNVQINRYQANGEIHRANVTAPKVEEAAGALIATVQGLSDRTFKSYARKPVDPDTGNALGGVPLSAAGPDGIYFSNYCFRGPQTVTFKTPGGGPSAVYAGNRYGSNITSAPPNLPSCGYDASDLQTAYGLKQLYQKKWDGTGQTIVIVDAYGSPTIVDDANTYSSINGLPPLTSSNFTIYTAGGTSTCTPAEGCSAPGWYPETTLDVETAHAIAPGANIVLIETTDNTDTNLDLGILYATENLLGNVISNSYGGPEVPPYNNPTDSTAENLVNELAAAFGISANFSTGDDGDFSDAIGFTAVSMPASSPYATAIGGTSLFLNHNKTMNFQTGWGLNETRIANPSPNPPTIPPLEFGFIFGAGGGTSVVWHKPPFQKSLKGAWRKLPDISMDADPETGFEIVITPDAVPGDPQAVEVYGGTSLSCPMFSALWAIANQVAGTPLGQAATYVYDLPPGALYDVTDVSSPYNVTGIIFNPPNPPQVETADSLVQPLENTKNYVSALFNSSTSTRWDVFTFGTDTSLTTGPGWDNVTGVGTPIGLPFVEAVAAAAAAANSH
jgi:subtilase family serine protease